MSRKYCKTHEWVQKEGNLYVVGITDYAQEELGDIVFMNLPNVGDEVIADEPFADVESVKAVSDILSPYTGRIAEVNEDLLDRPELINEDPYKAWIVKLEDVSDSAELMGEAEYLAFIEQEG
ncbi:MAG TPA: glycine cleavage system protein GcvH [Clostridiales bacterium]|jgi:glycine cleavage system H protein|nr:glycine cleavage system protein GcvH [Clostridiales bacterium]